MDATRRLLLQSAAALGGGTALVSLAHAQKAPPMGIGGGIPTAAVMPLPRIAVGGGGVPIVVRRLAVAADVAGRAAQVRIELVVHNPNDRVLEGELTFPLAEGQSVTGMALDIDGVLRDAVPVPKEKGRQVFEDVTRARVDPALLEATGANTYKLRVYPLPARGTRTVVLHLAQLLDARAVTGAPATAVLRLPLRLDGEAPVGALDVTVRAAGVAGAELRASWGGATRGALGIADGMAIGGDGSGGVLRLQRTAHAGPALLDVAMPMPRGAVVATGLAADRRYFYAEVPVSERRSARPRPQRVAVVWDASGSAAGRATARELALLSRYLVAAGRPTVDLHVVRDTVHVRTFAGARVVEDVFDAIAALRPDGASNLGAVTLGADVGVALLFSDGVSNWATRALPTSAVPLFAITTAPDTETAALRHLAEEAGGELLDLATHDEAALLARLTTEGTRVVAMRGHGARDLVLGSKQVQDGILRLAGVLEDDRAFVEIELRDPRGAIRVDRVAVQARPSATRAGDAADRPLGNLAPNRWAMLQLAQLDRDRTRHAGEIRRIGESFGLATRETSLIVLDTVADYARFEIEPPAELRAEYARLVGVRRDTQRAAARTQLARVVAEYEERIRWWETPFPKDRPPAKPAAVTRDAVSGRNGASAAREAMPRSEERMRMTAPAAAPAGAPASPPAAIAGAPARLAARADVAGNAQSADARTTAGPAATIQLAPFAATGALARRLRDASPAERESVYLDERRAHARSSAFFLEAADALFALDETALAIRALSNVAELAIENRQLLRMLGYRLQQARRADLAVPLFREVARLAPDEPQSFRDLGLALAETGALQPAIDALWEVVERPWHARFPGIETTALAELNAIVARAERTGTPLDTRRVDPRLLRNLPLGLRVVLAWDADNTDIDLWVTDPDGVKAYYGHRLTWQGARMSPDFTGGYGPEEFALRTPKPGVYTIEAQFFGHRQQVVSTATSLMLRLATDFGSGHEKERLTSMRLRGNGETVRVGTFTVPAPGDPAAS
jgi:tetratricopeptide (TPR) repeat protein